MGIVRLKNAVHQKNAYIAKQRVAAKEATRQAAAAKQEAYLARKQLREKEEEWRRQRQNQERARAERLRLRDPIHIYALVEGTSGFSRQDWKLVVDYHKGAHDLYLGEPCPDGTQILEVTEHESVFRFNLVVPSDVMSMGLSLPIVPDRL